MTKDMSTTALLPHVDSSIHSLDPDVLAMVLARLDVESLCRTRLVCHLWSKIGYGTHVLDGAVSMTGSLSKAQICKLLRLPVGVNVSRLPGGRVFVTRRGRSYWLYDSVAVRHCLELVRGTR